MTSWEDSQRALADQYCQERWGCRPEPRARATAADAAKFKSMRQNYSKGHLTKQFADLIWDKLGCLAKHSVFKTGHQWELRVRGDDNQAIAMAWDECVHMMSWLGDRTHRPANEQDVLRKRGQDEARAVKIDQRMAKARVIAPPQSIAPPVWPAKVVAPPKVVSPPKVVPPPKRAEPQVVCPPSGSTAKDPSNQGSQSSGSNADFVKDWGQNSQEAEDAAAQLAKHMLPKSSWPVVLSLDAALPPRQDFI